MQIVERLRIAARVAVHGADGRDGARLAAGITGALAERERAAQLTQGAVVAA